MSGSGTTFATETLTLAAEGATAYGREDLAERLAGARHLLSERSTTVYVVGEFKQGKSSLINALLASPVCPVDDDIATAVATEVAWSDRSQAVASYASAAGDDASPWTEDVPLDDIAAYVTENGNQGNRRRLRSVRVGVDRPLLSQGLTLVDTPGVGGLGSVHNAVTIGSLPQAHAVVFVSDASQELTAAEVRFLRTVVDLCPTLVVALTKIDLYSQWERIRSINEGHLRRAGIAVDQIPVSSTLRTMAAEDAELDAESGFPPLVERLEGVVRDADGAGMRAVGNHVLSVVGQLESSLRSRVETLSTPGRSASLVDELTRARDRADALRERSARWQQIFMDGFGDLTSDIDHDLRQRARHALQEAEKAIDEGDPADDWPTFEQWLRQRLAGEAMENYAMATHRVRQLTERVAEQFELGADEVVRPSRVLAPVQVVEEIDIDSSGAVQRKKLAGGLAGFQRAYMGYMMFTMLTNVASLALPFTAPLGVGMGLVLGRVGLGDERKRQLERRRGEARTAVRRFVDEFNLSVGKDSRDVLRQAQREMRDGYIGRVEELKRSTQDALDAAQRAVADDEQAADELERLRADLRTFGTVRDRAREILTHAGRARSSVAPAVAGRR